MSFNLIFFDLDGTLCETHEDVVSALNMGLKDLNERQIEGSVVKHYLGKGARNLVKGLFPHFSEELLEQLLALFYKYYSLRPCVKTRPYPNVVDTLKRLGGKRLICLTNKPASISKSLLAALDMERYFAEIFGGDSFENKKPAPDGVIHTCSKYSVPLSSTLIVGDTSVDIETAANAGCKACVVTYGYSRDGELAGADYMITDFSELLGIVS